MKKKNTPLKPVVVKFKHFHHDVHVFMGCTHAEMGKWIDKKMKIKEKSWENHCGAWEKDNSAGIAFMAGTPCIWLKKAPRCPETISYMAHEALHAMSYMAEKIGIKFHPDHSEEFYAYGISHIVCTVLESMKPKAKAKKVKKKAKKTIKKTNKKKSK